MLRMYLDHTGGGVSFDETTSALVQDHGLISRVLVSLFTWAPASDSELAEAGLEKNLGWWADAATVRDDDVSPEPLGSKLWLLRNKPIWRHLPDARRYCEEALAWMLEAGLVGSLEVKAENPRQGVLALEVVLLPPSGDAETWRMSLAF